MKESSSVKVRVKYYGLARSAISSSKNEEEITLRQDQLTVRELLGVLISKYGDRLKHALYTVDMGLRDGVLILVGGEKIDLLQGLDTRLDSIKDAQIVIMNAVAGG